MTTIPQLAKFTASTPDMSDFDVLILPLNLSTNLRNLRISPFTCSRKS